MYFVSATTIFLYWESRLVWADDDDLFPDNTNMDLFCQNFEGTYLVSQEAYCQPVLLLESCYPICV